MTGLMHEKELSRKTFLKGGGALIVGFSFLGAGVGAKTAVAADARGDTITDPFASNGPTALNQVDSFVVIHADNTASILPGGGEHGTGTSTGWLMLAGEELDMDMSQLTFVNVDTAVTPINVATNSSLGTKEIGPQVRAAAGYAKQTLLGLASTSLGVPVAGLTVASGVVSGGGKAVTYGELIGGKLFNVTIPGAPPTATQVAALASTMVQGVAPLKPVSQYTLVGTRVPRIDVPRMVAGMEVYTGDIRVPGMLHGRVVLPRGQAAYGAGAPVVSVDASSVSHIPNVQIVHNGDFLGVVAPLEYDAIQAAAQLKVTWADPPKISGSGNLWSKMRADDAAGLSPARDGDMDSYGQGPVGNVDAALASAAHVVSQSYGFPYNIHGPIGPGCCVADVTPNGALLMLHTQTPADSRVAVAQQLGLPVTSVRIKIYPSASHYGGAWARSDTPLAAAALSQAVGAPVRLQFMRWDEHGWDNYGPANLADLRGGIDASGNIVGFEYVSHQSPYYGVATTSQLLGTPLAANAGLSATEDSAMGEQYKLPNWRVLWKTLPLYNNYFKTTFMRASNHTQTNWATEIFMDELAYLARMDPIAFRRQNVSPVNTDRLLGVLDAITQASSWQPRVAASNLSKETIVTGRGVSAGPRKDKPYTSFSGVVAEIEVNKKTGKILVNQIYGAQDQGLCVNPMGVENQIVGQCVQSVSRAVLEEVRFNTERATSLDWVTYPILRFKDAPKVTPIVINRPDHIMTGAGDYTNSHVPAAIANAFFDATGVRIREAPMTSARVRATLKAAGVA
jgi:nicotinate dehydrogenase subunit B